MERLPFSVYDFFAYLAAGLVILVAGDYALDEARTLHADMPLQEALFWVLIAYIVGHANAALANPVVERGLAQRLIGRVPVQALVASAPAVWRARVFRDYFRPLPEAVRLAVRAKAQRQELVLGEPLPDLDVARSLKSYAVTAARSDATTAERLARFAELRDFCRNVTLASLAAAALVGGVTVFGSAPEGAWRWAVGALVVAVLLFFRFLRFHRHHDAEALTVYASIAG